MSGLNELTLSALAPYLSWDCPLHDCNHLAFIARMVAQFAGFHWTVDVKIADAGKKTLSMAAFVDSKSQRVYLLLQAGLGYSHFVSIPRKRVAESGSQDVVPIVNSRKLALSTKSHCIAVIGQTPANRCVLTAAGNTLTGFWPKAGGRETLKRMEGMAIVDMWASLESKNTVFTLRSSQSDHMSAVGASNMCLLSKCSLRCGTSAIQFKQLMCFEHSAVNKHCTVFFENDNVLFFAADTLDEIKKKKKKSAIGSVSKSPSSKRRKPKTEATLGLYLCLPPSFLKPKPKKKPPTALRATARRSHKQTPSVSRMPKSMRAPMFKVTRVPIPDALRYVFRDAKCHYAFWHESSESIVVLIKKPNESMVAEPKMKGFVDSLQQSYDSRGVEGSQRVLGRLLVKMKLCLSKGSQPSLASVSVGCVRIGEAQTRVVAYDSKKAAVWVDTKHRREGCQRIYHKRRRQLIKCITTHVVECRLRVMRLNDMVFKWRHVYSL